MTHRILVLLAVTVCAAFAAPADVSVLEGRLRQLQEQIATVQKEIQTGNAGPVPAAQSQRTNLDMQDLPAGWQPQKRMVAWQPMKRTVDEREPLIRAVEARLSEILRAGERLGVTADEVLDHLRARNAMTRE